MSGCGYTLLRRGVTSPAAGSGDLAAPTSGQTITLWQSNSNVNSTWGGPRWKRLIINIYSSHASAANGLTIDESVDGTNWRNVTSYTISATTYTKNYVAVSAPYIRVQYQNSANTLTTWEMAILGDTGERGTV